MSLIYTKNRNYTLQVKRDMPISLATMEHTSINMLISSFHIFGFYFCLK